jgi:hypothetical protein
MTVNLGEALACRRSLRKCTSPHERKVKMLHATLQGHHGEEQNTGHSMRVYRCRTQSNTENTRICLSGSETGDLSASRVTLNS